jgi:hypothetical protein
VTFRDSGYVAAAASTLTDGATPPQLSVHQSVVTFENPAKAADFILKTQDMWLHCSGAVVTIRNGNATEQHALGGVGAGEDIIVLDSAVAGQVGRGCSHAIAAKSNVVIDVHVCGAGGPAAARPLVSAVRDRVPS